MRWWACWTACLADSPCWREAVGRLTPRRWAGGGALGPQPPGGREGARRRGGGEAGPLGARGRGGGLGEAEGGREQGRLVGAEARACYVGLVEPGGEGVGGAGHRSPSRAIPEATLLS